MKHDVKFSQPKVSKQVDWKYVVSQFGIYKPREQADKCRLISFAGGVLYVDEDGSVEKAEPSAWKNNEFVRIPGETVTINFYNEEVDE